MGAVLFKALSYFSVFFISSAIRISIDVESQGCKCPSAAERSVFRGSSPCPEVEGVVFSVNIVTDVDDKVQKRYPRHTHCLSLWEARGQGLPSSVVLGASAAPGNLIKYKFLGFIQHLLNFKFWEWGPEIYALTSPPGDFNTHKFENHCVRDISLSQGKSH